MSELRDYLAQETKCQIRDISFSGISAIPGVSSLLYSLEELNEGLDKTMKDIGGPIEFSEDSFVIIGPISKDILETLLVKYYTQRGFEQKQDDYNLMFSKPGQDITLNITPDLFKTYLGKPLTYVSELVFGP